MSSGPKRVAVDFDGVLHTYAGWSGPIPTGEPIPGARGFIEDLQRARYEVVIISSRASSPEGKEGIRVWLSKWGFPDVAITNTKRAAIAYVDDRAVPYLGDFASCMERVRQLDNSDALFYRAGTDPRTCSNCRAWMMKTPPSSPVDDLDSLGRCAVLSSSLREDGSHAAAGSGGDTITMGRFYCSEHVRKPEGSHEDVQG